MHLISPFALTRPSSSPMDPGQSTATPVRFGCRFFAYLAAAPYEGQDEFVRQCLTTGGNSMKRQSQLPHDEKGDTTQTAIEDFEGTKEPFARKTGYGIAAIPFEREAKKASHPQPHNVFVHKSPYPTWRDSENYDRAAEAAATSRPKLVFNHIRETHKDKYQPVFKAENAHPFVQGDWMIMQHGDFPQGIIASLDKVLKQWHAQDPGSPLPQSDVDTERIACYVAARFRQKYGSVNIAHLPTDQVRDDYKAFMAEIIRNPDATGKGKGRAVNGNKGTYNLILSDGNRLFATNYSATKEMYVGKHFPVDGHEEVLMATDKIQPLPASGLTPIFWRKVEKNSVISVEREPEEAGQAARFLFNRSPFLPELPPEPTEV